jgi:hypothetical protein
MTIHPEMNSKPAWALSHDIDNILDDMGLVPNHGDLIWGNSWVISLAGSYEKAIGTSFTNEAAANLAADLIRRFHLANLGLGPRAFGSRASVLIIAPYSAMYVTADPLSFLP